MRQLHASDLVQPLRPACDLNVEPLKLCLVFRCAFADCLRAIGSCVDGCLGDKEKRSKQAGSWRGGPGQAVKPPAKLRLLPLAAAYPIMHSLLLCFAALLWRSGKAGARLHLSAAAVACIDLLISALLFAMA